MKRIIRWALNHLPRTLLQRLAGWLVPVAGIFYIGRSRTCPVCGAHLRKFMPYGYDTPREDALCPRCLSLERHRALWMLITDRDMPELRGRLLHIAPEACFIKRLRRMLDRAGGEYVTADLESPLADLHFDVQQIPLEDGYADIIICNHLLEHVADDRRAIAELYRVMRHGGRGIVTVPVDMSRAQTFEDDTVTDPAERARIFGQYDHRRICGRDYAERLREAGFEVAEMDPTLGMSDGECRRFSVRRNEPVYLLRKR